MKSYKTTILGILAALYVAIEPLVSQGSIDYERLLWASIIAVAGYIVKDYNVSGKP